MKILPSIYFLMILILECFFIRSCSSKRFPNLVYMPDMYYSEAYEAYSHPEVISLLPVTGSVPRNEEGLLPYDIPNTNDGYESSKKITYSPLNSQEIKKNIDLGKKMYNINCSHCHGENGDGLGFLVKNVKILGVPSYKDREEITIGSVFHVIMSGKNNMGAYTSQLKMSDCWKVAMYVIDLKKCICNE
jgi:mono/diheme cytochrome c family protein